MGLQSGDVETLENTSTVLQRLHRESHLLQHHCNIAQ
jgi:hypothetical protein